MKMKLLSVLTLALVLSVGASAQTILAGWTFDDTDTYAREKLDSLVYYADQGIDENLDSKFIAATQDDSWPAVFNSVEFKNGAAKYINWDNGSDVKSISVQLKPQGATDIKVAFKIASGGSNNPGPKDWKVQAEDTSDVWHDLKTDLVLTNDFETYVLALPSDFNNMNDGDKFNIRWIMTSNDAVGGGSVAANGTVKIDSVVVSGMNPILDADDVNAEAVSVYPNPATDVVNVIGADAVEIINAVGVVVKSVVGESVISVADLNAGIYFVRTEDNLTKLVVE